MSKRLKPPREFFFHLFYRRTNFSNALLISRSFHCLECRAEFPSNDLLLEHLKVHDHDEIVEHQVDSIVSFNKSSQPQNTCHICSRTFARARNLERHKLIHAKLKTKPTDFQCTICGWYSLLISFGRTFCIFYFQLDD